MAAYHSIVSCGVGRAEEEDEADDSDMSADENGMNGGGSSRSSSRPSSEPMSMSESELVSRACRVFPLTFPRTYPHPDDYLPQKKYNVELIWIHDGDDGGDDDDESQGVRMAGKPVRERIKDYDIQLRWLYEDEDENEDEEDDAAMGESKDEAECKDQTGKNSLVRIDGNNRPIKRRRVHQRVPKRMEGLYHGDPFEQHATGYVCFDEREPMRYVTEWLQRGDMAFRTMLPVPLNFITLLRLPSLQALRSLCLTMEPILLTWLAPHLPPTLVTLQVTFETKFFKPDSAAVQIYLPTDLAQRMQHCQQLRQFIILHQLMGADAADPPVYGCTPLSSLYALQELSETLPELETIQWHVTANPTRLLLEYEKMCHGQACAGKAGSAAVAAASNSASESSSSSSSPSPASIPTRSTHPFTPHRRHRHRHHHRPPPPRLRHISSLMLSGKGRLSCDSVDQWQQHDGLTDFLDVHLPFTKSTPSRKDDADADADESESTRRMKMGQDKQLSADAKMSRQEVEAVTAVLAWFGDSVRHIRVDVEHGQNSVIETLATRWPESIRSSLTDLSVFCEGSVELSACLDALPTLQLPSIRCLTILLPRGRTSMPAESIGRVLRCMSQLTDLGLQIAPTMPLHSLPTLPALTALAVAWPYAWSKRKRRTHIKEHGDKSVGHHDTSALPILTIHILYIDINDMSGSLTM